MLERCLCSCSFAHARSVLCASWAGQGAGSRAHASRFVSVNITNDIPAQTLSAEFVERVPATFRPDLWAPSWILRTMRPYTPKQENRVMAGLSYPATRYDPSPVVDLASKAERERLSPSALKAFFNMMDRWSVRDEDARQLLGGVTNGPYYEMKKAPAGRMLEADKLLRVSYLVGIFKALNILHAKKLADDWVQLPNTNRIFAGQSPLAFMMAGGAPAMQTVRRLLDARRGGV